MKIFFILVILFLSSCSNLQENTFSTTNETDGVTSGASKIDREGIRQTFISHQKELQLCYKTALKNNKELKGKLVFDFTIGQAGKVLKANVDPKRSTLVSEELGSCIQKLILSWTFPPPPDKQEVQVYYPMGFSPEKK